MWRNQFERFRKFYDTPGDGGAGGGAPAGDPSGAVASPPIPGAGNVPPSGAAGAGTGQPAGGAGGGDPNRPTYQYAEDRSQWVPPHRLREVTQRLQTMESALSNYQQRVRALMGVAEPENPRVVELKNAMKEMFPGLAPFIDNPKLHEQLMNGQFNGREGFDGFQNAYWNRHALETVNEAITEYAKAAGIDASKLGDGAVRQMARQIQSFIGNDPERRAAYESRDPSFMRAFIADLTGFFVNPFRQQTTVTGARHIEQNRGLPSTRGANIPPSGANGGDPQRPKGKALHEAARQALLAATEGQ